MKRRNFIKTIVGTTALLSMPSLAFAKKSVSRYDLLDYDTAIQKYVEDTVRAYKYEVYTTHGLRALLETVEDYLTNHPLIKHYNVSAEIGINFNKRHRKAYPESLRSEQFAVRYDYTLGVDAYRSRIVYNHADFDHAQTIKLYRVAT